MKFLLAAFFSSLSLLAQAQDVHLTQYYTSNLSLNPAYTGYYDGDIRLVTNYRNQWRQVTAPLQTNMFSVEKKIILHRDQAGMGLIVMNDRLSVFQLNTNKVYLAGSYQKELKGHILRAGIQAGVVLRKTDFSNQTFPLQWNKAEGSFDLAKNSGETSLPNQVLYPSFNAGFAWSRKFKNKKITAGYGVFHMNRPVDGFISNMLKLPFRHTFNAKASLPLQKQYVLMPHLLYMHTGGATDFILGTNVGKKINNDVGVMLGAGYRGSPANSDAFLLYTGLTYKRIDFGFSVDFNVSQLSKQSKSKTAYEISLIYTTPALFSSKATIPCDRY